jgi:hypothetical protein
LKAHQKENINERLGVKRTEKRQKIRHMLMENVDNPYLQGNLKFFAILIFIKTKNN